MEQLQVVCPSFMRGLHSPRLQLFLSQQFLSNPDSAILCLDFLFLSVLLSAVPSQVETLSPVQSYLNPDSHSTVSTYTTLQYIQRI